MRIATRRTNARKQAREHEWARDHLGLFASDQLDDVEWLTVRTHVQNCPPCQEELHTPRLWNRAAPQRIPPRPVETPAPNPPWWPVLLGTVIVAGLVAAGVGYGLASLP